MGKFSIRRAGWGLAGLLVGGAALAVPLLTPARSQPTKDQPPQLVEVSQSSPLAAVGPGGVYLSASQQEAIGLETRQVEAGALPRVLKAPGQVMPDEGRYAFITPRAAGVVRSVAAQIGQKVKAGDLLAEIDSPEVAQARLNLISQLQAEEIARASAGWQEQIHHATADLIVMLRDGDTPEAIQTKLADRDVGPNLDRLMTAYSRYRLANASYDRSVALRANNAVSVEMHQKARAEHEAAVAAYKAMIESIEFQSRIEYSRARQALKQAETAVRVARARLRILGVQPETSTSETLPEGTTSVVADAGSSSEATPDEAQSKLESIRVDPIDQASIGTFSIRAPFDGTIIERELIVPGVAVNTNHRIFQLADLSKVWVEVKIREADFGKLVGQQKGKVRFTSPAYPDRTFEGRVIYTGDLVDQQTRAILLLAEAENPERLLKPGMFVEVEVVSPKTQTAAFIPQSALMSMDDDRFVYVRTGPEQFARRGVELGTQRGQQVAVLSGLAVGDEVVVHGAFKLKAAAEHMATDAVGRLAAKVPGSLGEL